MGLAKGFEILVEFKPNEGLHEYELPKIDGAPNTTFPPEQIIASGPVNAVGSELTFTVTVSLFEHPVLGYMAVNIYVVVADGLADGLAILVELKPTEGVQ